MFLFVFLFQIIILYSKIRPHQFYWNNICLTLINIKKNLQVIHWGEQFLFFSFK